MAGSDGTVTSEEGRIWAGARHLAIGTLVALAVLAALSALASAQTEPPATGDWNVSDDTVITDRTIQLLGDLNVTGNLTLRYVEMEAFGNITVVHGNLTIVSTSVALDFRADHQVGISLQSGTISLLDTDDDPRTTEDATRLTSMEPFDTALYRLNVSVLTDDSRLVAHASIFRGITINVVVGHLEMIGCDIADTGVCIFAIAAKKSTNLMEDCTFSNATYCIWMMGTKAVMRGCTFSRSGTAIDLNASQDDAVVDCKVTACDVGLRLERSVRITVEGTSIEDCGIGALLDHSSDVFINRTTVQRSTSDGLNITYCARVDLNDAVVRSSAGVGVICNLSIVTMTRCSVTESGKAGLAGRVSVLMLDGTTIQMQGGTGMVLGPSVSMDLYNCTLSIAGGYLVDADRLVGIDCYNTSVPKEQVKEGNVTVIRTWRQVRVRVAGEGGAAPPLPIVVVLRDRTGKEALNQTLQTIPMTSWTWIVESELMNGSVVVGRNPHDLVVSVAGMDLSSRLDIVANGEHVVVVPSGKPPRFSAMPEVKMKDKGAPREIPLSGYLEDPDDTLANLTVRVSVVGGGVITANVSDIPGRGWVLIVAPVKGATGTVQVILNATDPHGMSGAGAFNVTVERASAGHKGIEGGWGVACVVLLAVACLTARARRKGWRG